VLVVKPALHRQASSATLAATDEESTGQLVHVLAFPTVFLYVPVSHGVHETTGSPAATTAVLLKPVLHWQSCALELFARDCEPCGQGRHAAENSPAQ